MKKTLQLTLFILGTFFAGSGIAQNNIGYVNSAEVFNSTPEIETVRRDLHQFTLSLDAQMATLSQTFQELVLRYQNLAVDSPEAVRRSLELEIQDMENRISAFEREAQYELKEKEAQLMQPVIDRVDQAIRKVASTNNYQHVFDTESTLVYPVENELTSKVITELKR